MKIIYNLSFLLSLVVMLSSASLADSFGINLYGRSIHTGENVVNRKYFNEVNDGIGFRADFGSMQGHSFFFEGGKYKDSFNNDARYLSMAYQVKIIAQLRFGLNGAIYNTKSANKGETFFVPTPILSYRVWRIILNSVYLPKHEPINPYHVFGFYLTLNIVQNNR